MFFDTFRTLDSIFGNKKIIKRIRIRIRLKINSGKSCLEALIKLKEDYWTARVENN